SHIVSPIRIRGSPHHSILMVKCPYVNCEADFDTVQRLDAHKTLHYAGQQLMCKYCRSSPSFSSYANAKRHYSNTHDLFNAGIHSNMVNAVVVLPRHPVNSPEYQEELERTLERVRNENYYRSEDEQQMVVWPEGDYSYERLVKLVVVDGAVLVEVKWPRPWYFSSCEPLSSIHADDPNVTDLLERMAESDREFFTESVNEQIRRQWMVDMSGIFYAIDEREIIRCLSPQL
ncbi:hypothetical protein PENTCL1PPCAC_98, partial [Pristionchus entomophagus]